jgi:hypothetical protein
VNREAHVKTLAGYSYRQTCCADSMVLCFSTNLLEMLEMCSRRLSQQWHETVVEITDLGAVALGGIHVNI